jgi:hypothetical protein
MFLKSSGRGKRRYMFFCREIDNCIATRGMSVRHTFLSWRDRRERKRAGIVHASAFGLPVEKAVG